ncbi:DUF2577 domain-containing protein [Clostridium sp. MSJ-11]|uniref:DUF2577 domain-containing protein n=1 Tax=Clostridium mobile TaxID=2841512 RepID=A0ABS6EJ61_9CLOT|nr:DUF2577 domain-containing protein [Clostridium mobile]MBU5485252.1 DUF2577 domain-containing protein [Clostridium mobile]
MGMIDIIKKAGVDAVGANNPVNILFGEVLNVEDLKIKIDQKLILSKEFFIIPQSLTKYEIDLGHSHSYSNGSTSKELNKIVIREGLKQGDRVLLLRVQGGQQYVVLDKVV